MNILRKNQNGFTLVELAIVIVIIGLLVGGVLQGQSLIDASKASRIVSDVNKYNAAILTFQSKYNALPGDMRNAYTFFDGTGGTSICGSNLTYNDNNNNTLAEFSCNGAGNGVIGNINDLTDVGRLWVHLTLSKVIPGLMTYKPTVGYLNLTISPKDSANAPSPDGMPTVVYDFQYYGRYGGSGSFIYGQTGLFMTLSKIGRPDACAGQTALARCRQGSGASESMAFMIDNKMDDGLPTSGSVISAQGYFNSGTESGGNCVKNPATNNGPPYDGIDVPTAGATAPSNTFLYDIKSRTSNDPNSCMMFFKTGQP